MVIERLKARFREPLEVELENAHDRFREERKEEIEAAEERFEELRAEVENWLEELGARLEELEGYEDVEERTVIEDVADNIAAERKRMVEQFSFPGDPGKLREELEDFVDGFKTMKRKETEVLKVVGDDKKPVFDALGRLEDAKGELEILLEGQYAAVETAETLDRLTGELEELEERKEELREELGGMDLGFIREKIEEVEGKLDQLHDSEEWEEYREIRQELEKKREELEETRSGVAKAANRMERGLKKLLYESSPPGREVLEEIRDGNVEELLGRDPSEVEEAVRSAVEALPEDLLGERQEKKFRDAAGEMQGFGERVDRIEELEEEIEQLEQELEEHPAPEREDRLASELDGLQEELQDARKERRELRDEIEEVEEALERVREKIEEELQDAFRREVEVS